MRVHVCVLVLYLGNVFSPQDGWTRSDATEEQGLVKRVFFFFFGQLIMPLHGAVGWFLPAQLLCRGMSAAPLHRIKAVFLDFSECLSLLAKNKIKWGLLWGQAEAMSTWVPHHRTLVI